jgi:alkylated DNA repair dioxygenase AlkB
MGRGDGPAQTCVDEMSAPQLALFEDRLLLPAGMHYHADIITPGEEAALVAFIRTLPLKPFEFVGGFTGNRRVMSFGWRYDFGKARLEETQPIPPELRGLRDKAGAAFGLDPAGLEHALVTEYAPGAGIGWHKDRPDFADVIGVSLLVPCNFRLRRKQAGKWRRVTLMAEPRSAYLLNGEARREWEHSIPPLEELRYSVTFRNLMREPS